MKRSAIIVLAALLALLVLGAVYLSVPGHVPEGQPALLQIDNQSLPELQADFDRTPDELRLILLMSPT